MKKTLGGLLAVLGLGGILIGVFQCMDFISQYNQEIGLGFERAANIKLMIAVGFGLLALAGLVFLWVGIKLYRTDKKRIAPKVPVPEFAQPVQPATPKPPQPVQPAAPSGMICPECGKKYPLDQVYCDECGALLKEIK